MKVKQVSAFRSKRGLRRVSGAGPQVVGLTPGTTDERKMDAMKRYILRGLEAVEAEKINASGQGAQPETRGQTTFG